MAWHNAGTPTHPRVSVHRSLPVPHWWQRQVSRRTTGRAGTRASESASVPRRSFRVDNGIRTGELLGQLLLSLTGTDDDIKRYPHLLAPDVYRLIVFKP